MSGALLALCCISFAAGFIDAIAGGGGLLLLPALFVLLPPATAPALVLGTNKFAAFAGTAAAATRYARAVSLTRPVVIPAALAALPLSYLGAYCVRLVSPGLFRPLVLFLLVGVAIYTFFRKDFGSLHAPKLSRSAQIALAILIGAGLGFYDGFFGPGTGSFLIVAFIGLFRFDFLNASASAKLVNCATNIAALVYFVATRNVLFAYALPMALCNVAGGLLGARLAILNGSQFVRLIFLAVVIAIIARFAWEIFGR